jgi:hypothetical protein
VVWQRVQARAELEPGYRVYDATRHTFILFAARLGVPRERRKLLVGHAPSHEAHDRYLHGLDELLLADADRVSGGLVEALFGVVR